MSRARLTSGLFGCALALVFFFGNLAPGLAHETLPGSSMAGQRFDGAAAGRLSRAGAQLFPVVFIGEISDVVTPLPEFEGPPRTFAAPPEMRLRAPLIIGGPRGQKISRHLLDSILLI